MKKAVEGGNIPKAVGPYSQAIMFGNLVFCSGQIGKDPKSDKLKDGIELQTKQIFSNLKIILKEAGSDLKNILKVNVYLKDLSDYSSMNKIYETQFEKPFPARATVGIVNLPAGALIEIECIAYKSFHHDEHEESGCCGDCSC